MTLEVFEKVNVVSMKAFLNSHCVEVEEESLVDLIDFPSFLFFLFSFFFLFCFFFFSF